MPRFPQLEGNNLLSFVQNQGCGFPCRSVEKNAPLETVKTVYPTNLKQTPPGPLQITTLSMRSSTKNTGDRWYVRQTCAKSTWLENWYFSSLPTPFQPPVNQRKKLARENSLLQKEKRLAACLNSLRAHDFQRKNILFPFEKKELSKQLALSILSTRHSDSKIIRMEKMNNYRNHLSNSIQTRTEQFLGKEMLLPDRFFKLEGGMLF